MINITHRLAVISQMAHAEGLGRAKLIVHYREGNHHTGSGPWIAAIAHDEDLMPLLDSVGDQSLAAAGETPLEALRNLDDKLGTLP